MVLQDVIASCFGMFFPAADRLVALKWLPTWSGLVIWLRAVVSSGLWVLPVCVMAVPSVAVRVLSSTIAASPERPSKLVLAKEIIVKPLLDLGSDSMGACPSVE